MFILLAEISYCTFDLFINNIVRELILDESLFYIFLNSLGNNVLGKISFARNIRLLIIAFFILDWAFTFKVEGTGVVISGFLFQSEHLKRKFYSFCLVHG